MASSSHPVGTVELSTVQANEENLDHVERQAEPEPPYSIYTRQQKWIIVAIASCAGLFSPLTANIYFPAIPTLVVAFDKTTELINLTVTMYMVLQSIAPMVFGSLSDTIGRRVMSIVCLCILSASCVGLALVPTNAYWLLMVLRCVQATGSASNIALGAGMIADIAPPSERAGFFGVYGAIPLIGPAIGPVLGGALSDHLGWRAIFWFLCIASAACALIMFLFLPETLRTIAGDGSVRVPPIYRPVIPIVGNKFAQDAPTMPKRKFTIKNPLPLLLNLDIDILLAYNGIVAAAFFTVLTSISTLYLDIYDFLDETTVGLCFLPVGGGMAASSVFVGALLDWDYRRMKAKLRARGGNDTSGEIGEFPIEKARLRLMPIFLGIFVASTAGYGWCLQQRVNIAGPLILSFIIGSSSISIFNATQSLSVDLVPKQSSSVSACNNLFRGAISAMFVALIDLMLRRLKPGWTYFLMACLCLALMPVLWLITRIGPVWRKKRAAKETN